MAFERRATPSCLEAADQCVCAAGTLGGSSALPIRDVRKRAGVPPQGNDLGAPPLAVSARIRKCGRATPTITSTNRSPAISETRSPQQQASLKITRFMRALLDRGARRCRSPKTKNSSHRVRIFVCSMRHVKTSAWEVLFWIRLQGFHIP